MIKLFFKFCFWLTGWKLVGSKPDLKKYVIIVAPHTSNWDFFLGVAARSLSDLKSAYLAKKSLFDIPVIGSVMRGLGGYPVDRSKHTNMVDQVVGYFNSHEHFVISITPEGTRSYNPDWKTGFYRIAVKANVPIVKVAFDFEHKVVRWEEPFYPTGDSDKEIEEIKNYYRKVKGKYPEKGVL